MLTKLFEKAEQLGKICNVKHIIGLLADLGKIRGCFTNTVVIIHSLSEWSSSIHTITAPPSPNGHKIEYVAQAKTKILYNLSKSFSKFSGLVGYAQLSRFNIKGLLQTHQD